MLSTLASRIRTNSKMIFLKKELTGIQGSFGLRKVPWLTVNVTFVTDLKTGLNHALKGAATLGVFLQH